MPVGAGAPGITAPVLDLKVAAPRRAPGRTQRGLAGLLAARGWPLTAILVVQAALSLHLIWSNTAFQDEAEYLLAGHLELAHLAHGTPVPLFSSYFSGAPVVYPPLAAFFDSIGGLAAARLLSLAFMLLATVLLHGVTTRLLDNRVAAWFAAAVFAWLGPTQFLGAFATYDAMALCLLAVATWLGVRAVAKNGAAYCSLIACAGLAMAIADAAKYASVLFDPVIVLVVGLAAWREKGLRSGVGSSVLLALVTGALLGSAYKLAGPNYALGIDVTTLKRPPGGDPVSAVIDLSVHGIAIAAALAVLGAIIISSQRRDRPTVLLAWLLVLATFLAPANQARIHTTVSLFKHLAFGTWFGAIVAGYALSEVCALLVRWLGRHGGARSLSDRFLAVAVAVVIVAGLFGLSVANDQYHVWPNSRTMVGALARLNHPKAYLLAEDYDVPAYYLRSSAPFAQWITMYYMGDWDAKTKTYLTGLPAYALAIQQRYYAGIVMNFSDSDAMDQVILKDIGTYKTYYMYKTIHYRTSAGSGEYQIWAPTPVPAGAKNAR